MPDFLSVAEVSRRLGIGRQSVLGNIYRGKLPATLVGRSYVIKAADFEDYVRREAAVAAKKLQTLKNAIAE